MVALIIGMLICVGLALAVLGLVAIPARREGRELLTPKGEETLALARERTQATIERTGDVISATRERVSDSVSSSPLGDKVDDTTSRKAS
jgi:hypothetical protein